MPPKKRGKGGEKEEGRNEDGVDPSKAFPYALINRIGSFLSRQEVRDWKTAEGGRNMSGMVHRNEKEPKKMYYDIIKMVPRIKEQFSKLYDQDKKDIEKNKELRRQLQAQRGQVYRSLFQEANESTKDVYKQLKDYLERKINAHIKRPLLLDEFGDLEAVEIPSSAKEEALLLATRLAKVRFQLEDMEHELEHEQPLSYFDWDVSEQLKVYRERRKQDLSPPSLEEQELEKKLFVNPDIKDVYEDLRTVIKTFNLQQSFSLMKLLCKITQLTNEKLRVFADVDVQREFSSSIVKIGLKLQDPEQLRRPGFLFEISTEIVFQMDANDLKDALEDDNGFADFDFKKKYRERLEPEKEYDDGIVASQYQILYDIRFDEKITGWGMGGQLFGGSNFGVDQVKFMELARWIRRSNYQAFVEEPLPADFDYTGYPNDFSALLARFADCYADFKDTDSSCDHLWRSGNAMLGNDASGCIVKLMQHVELPYRIKMAETSPGGGAAEEEGEDKVVMVSSFLDKTLHLQ